MANGYLGNINIMGDGSTMDYNSEYSPTPVVIGQTEATVDTYDKIRNDPINEIYDSGFRCWSITFFMLDKT